MRYSISIRFQDDLSQVQVHAHLLRADMLGPVQLVASHASLRLLLCTCRRVRFVLTQACCLGKLLAKGFSILISVRRMRSSMWEQFCSSQTLPTKVPPDALGSSHACSFSRHWAASFPVFQSWFAFPITSGHSGESYFPRSFGFISHWIFVSCELMISCLDLARVSLSLSAEMRQPSWGAHNISQNVETTFFPISEWMSACQGVVQLSFDRQPFSQLIHNLLPHLAPWIWVRTLRPHLPGNLFFW